MDARAHEIDRIVREVLAERRGAAVRSDPLQRVASDRDRLKAVTTNGSPGGGDESCGCGCGKTTGAGQREQTLRLDAPVVTLADLEGRLDGHRTLAVGPKSVLTPSALDYLRAKGVAVERTNTHEAAATARWAYAIDEAAGVSSGSGSGTTATALVETLTRDANAFRGAATHDAAALVAACIDLLEAKNVVGVVLLTARTAAMLCLCNRDPRVRAVLATSVRETAEAVRAIGANVLVVDPAGRPFYELRQIVRVFCTGGRREWPQLAANVSERPDRLDGPPAAH